MEGTGQINDSLENSVEAPRLKGMDSEASTQPGNCNLLESNDGLVSTVADWHRNNMTLRSTEFVMDSIKGKGLVNNSSSQSGSALLGSTPLTTHDSDEMVEELTLNNFKHPNLSLDSLPSSSKTGDELQTDMGLWQNFYKLVGKPKDALTISGNRGNLGNVSIDNVEALRFPSQNDSSNCEHSHGNDGHDPKEKELSTSPKGIRTKVLSASGFPQFLVKSSLKDKCIPYSNPGSYSLPRMVTQPRNISKTPAVSKKDFHNVWERSDNTPSAYGGGPGLDTSNNGNGISLRQWLKPGKCKIDTVERLQIFKKVLELVDSSHSKGIALQHLRPSYFMILPSNEVKYIGYFVRPASQFEGTLSQFTDHYLRRKRYLSQGAETSTSLSKYPKLGDEVKLGNVSNQIGGQGNLKGELPKGFMNDSHVVGNPGLDYREQPTSHFGGSTSSPADIESPAEERWYASPEELNGNACPFTSNIYSLGVLLFELFCSFESWEAHATAMLDLRHRILPSRFLSESPKEAGFCLWLLHPEPSSRPKTREILQCDLMRSRQEVSSTVQSQASLDEQDAEAELLLNFLLTVIERKEQQAEKLVSNIGCVSSDIKDVERRQSSRIKNSSAGAARCSDVSQTPPHDEPIGLSPLPRSSTSSMSEERIMRNIDHLEKAYFLMRSRVEHPESNVSQRSDNDVLRNSEKWPLQNSNNDQLAGESDRLGSFFDGLCKYARYSKFEVCGTLRNGDILTSANVICSLSFDRDEEYFAAAGVAKKIKIFEYTSFLNDSIDIHYPVVEMSSKSRLSCVCWNSYIKNYLASTDYDGTVQLWDASTGHGFAKYAEHQRRAWSVDFSHMDPTKFASGSDDSSVKLWSLNDKSSVGTIRNVANVCCVQFSAHSTNLLAFGSADYKIYVYDLRNTRVPWCTLVGHGKAVSYVKFVDSETLVSASTDNTLKLWDLNKSSFSGLSTDACKMTFKGHTNEKNFVGLSVSEGYISCGSETNEVYAYYKTLPMPITSHKFGSIDPISGQETCDDDGQFVSSVCWREKSDMVVAANSSGCIKLLHLV